MKISGPDYQLIVHLCEDVPTPKNRRPDYYRQQTGTLLATAFSINEPVLHAENGAPFLSEKFVSISHSNEFLAIMIAGVPCGIDVQVPDLLLNRGKDWFYNDQEQEVFGNMPLESQLYSIWCAKEAFFKMKQGHIDDLRSEVSVREIHADHTRLLYRGHIYTVQHVKTDRYYLAYCFEPAGN